MVDQAQQTPIHEEFNVQLLMLIPPDARRIVDVGCGGAALASAYRTINPDVHYRGIEILEEYAEVARKHCDDAIVCDIEKAPVEWYWDQRADCWVFGDVLEHLVDPWAVLHHIRHVIPHTGSVVACIPNVQHWSVQAKLCVGQWIYTESGLLDRSHMRFFTRETMLEMFQRTGFKVVACTPRPVLTENLDLLRAIVATAKICGGDPELAALDALTYQFVVRAEPC